MLGSEVNSVVEEGDTDTAPFGMGTYASRSTPVAGAAVAMVSRKIRAKARKIAAHLLEVSDEDIEWELGRFYVRGNNERGVTIQDCALAAYSNMPDGLEPGLEESAVEIGQVHGANRSADALRRRGVTGAIVMFRETCRARAGAARMSPPPTAR